MGKKKPQHRSGSGSGSSEQGQDRRAPSSASKSKSSSNAQPPQNQQPSASLMQSIEKWLRAEQQGILWILGCVAIGCLFGFGIGSGWLTGAVHLGYGASSPGAVAPWRIELGARIRSSLWYEIMFLWQPQLSGGIWLLGAGKGSYKQGVSSPPPSSSQDGTLGVGGGLLHASHPRVYAVLREAIIREINGYVHPDLGLMTPAPCGAQRGLGMVRDSYHDCQSKCLPGVAKEKMDLQRAQQQKLQRNPRNKTLWLPPIPDRAEYKQEEVLIRVPLSFQMTRAVALETIVAHLPADVQRKANPHELDDAALLVLLLAHERGVGRHSRWLPYIASLPPEPSCGYSPKIRQSMLTSMHVLKEELGVDTYGWQGELSKAYKNAVQIVHGLTKDYGAYLQTPEGLTPFQNIEWALCQVTSRATAGSEAYGSLRLVPLMDMLNHDAAAGGFVELSGKERLAHGDFVEATEDDAGTFVVRSLRHGRRKALKKGQELLVNYNVPHYSPLDWFVSLGFVPPERQTQWQKVDAALPKVRQDSFGVAGDSVPTTQLWEEELGPELVVQYKEQQKRKRQKPTAPAVTTTATTTSPSSGGTNST